MVAKGRGRGESKASPRRISAAERRNLAVQRKIAGMSYEEIAASPISREDPTPLYPGEHGRKRAWEAVNKVMNDVVRETRGHTEELRAIELMTLDTMQKAQFPSVLPRRAVKCPECEHTLWREPDQGAANTVLRIMERRAKYTGIDASDEADERLVALMEKQVALANRALVEAMERAGISPEVQREVLDHAGDILREAEAEASG